jgi:DNA-directed RNA polymerase beta subunit
MNPRKPKGTILHITEEVRAICCIMLQTMPVPYSEQHLAGKLNEERQTIHHLAQSSDKPSQLDERPHAFQNAHVREADLLCGQVSPDRQLEVDVAFTDFDVL